MRARANMGQEFSEQTICCSVILSHYPSASGVERGPTLVKPISNVASIGPKLAGPRLAEIGPTLADIGPQLVKVGPTLPEVDPTSFDELPPHLVNIGLPSTDFGLSA